MRPCPFCTSKEISISISMQKIDRKVDERFFAECEQCCAAGPAKNSKEEALYAWNERKLNDEEVLNWVLESFSGE